MALKVTTTATVTYTCWLSEEDSQKVIERADEEGEELTEAVAYLYDAGEISLYDDATESDFSTESIESVECG